MLTAKPQASGRWAVGAAATSGSVSPGIGYYHSKFELGIDRAHYVYAAEDNLTILALWGGLGRSLSERLNLVYGASVVNLFQGPKSDFKFSPYIRTRRDKSWILADFSATDVKTVILETAPTF